MTVKQAAKKKWDDFVLGCKVLKEGAKKGFSYDGCTAVPDFDFGADCCNTHDYHYQLQDVSRAEADKKLRECIKAKGHPILAWVYWSGVRVFGGGFWKRRQQEFLGDSNESSF